MVRKIEKYLCDILDCIDEIDSYFIDYPRQFQTYCDKALLRSAIHMQLAIIGEATNHILKISPDIQISNARQIIGTRNYIIHGYDSLHPAMIWAIVINDLPKLRSEVAALLER
ncbi:MAG: DUF86 domain-containing protein [Muribaculaceae bacterium]|nr:DUF86 domain-containing protein [Muribaculaceae bacterium]